MIDAHVGLGTRTMSPARSLARPSLDASPTSDEWSGGENSIFIFFSNHWKARGSMSPFAAHAHIVPDNEHIIILHLNTTNSSSREAFSLRDGRTDDVAAVTVRIRRPTLLRATTRLVTQTHGRPRRPSPSTARARDTNVKTAEQYCPRKREDDDDDEDALSLPSPLNHRLSPLRW